MESFLQVGFAFDRLFAHLAMLDLIPDLLVGIEFRRMRRKKEHPQLGPMRPHELAHGGGAMKRGVIRHENQGPSSTLEHLLQKRKIPVAIDRVFRDRVAQAPCRRGAVMM